MNNGQIDKQQDVDCGEGIAKGETDGGLNKGYKTNMVEAEYRGFDWALGVMKRGNPVKRTGWNGRGIAVWMEKGVKAFRKDEPIPALIDGIRREYFEWHDGVLTRAPNFCIRSESGVNVRGWAPSQTDLMAEDWCFA